MTKPAVVSKPDPKKPVNLLPVTQFLFSHITEALCEKVFREKRTVERQRKWTLHALAQFWLAVAMRAPDALSQALHDCSFPGSWLVETTDEAFFMRCKDFSWVFFAELYKEFTARVVGEAPLSYARAALPLRRHFPDIFAVDGSQLSKIMHRLKITWPVEGAILPGRIWAVYDIFRGISRAVFFEPDAAKSEHKLAQQFLKTIAKETLLLGDRLYGLPVYFGMLAELGLWGLFRRNSSAGVRTTELLSRVKYDKGILKVSFVIVGEQKLRRIVYRKGKKRLDLLTNVLDAEKLPAEQAVDLYRERWDIERMFYDLKEVLNLNRFYAANPNAVAMQVYSAAMVHAAFRIAQAKLADEHKLEPEELSSVKLYPKLAAAFCEIITTDEKWEQTVKANPRVKLNKPDFGKLSHSRTWLGVILADKRKKRHVRAREKPHSKWLSWGKIEGGSVLLKKLT